MPIKILLIFVAGGLGTLARWSLATLVQRWAGPAFPWGTVAVNLLGCAAFGLVAALALNRAVIAPETRAVLLVGFMGAFTTFSTFVSETAGMLTEGNYLAGVGNILLQTLAGLAAFLLGVAVGRPT